MWWPTVEENVMGHKSITQSKSSCTGSIKFTEIIKISGLNFFFWGGCWEIAVAVWNSGCEDGKNSTWMSQGGAHSKFRYTSYHYILTVVRKDLKPPENESVHAARMFCLAVMTCYAIMEAYGKWNSVVPPKWGMEVKIKISLILHLYHMIQHLTHWNDIKTLLKSEIMHIFSFFFQNSEMTKILLLKLN